jgi:hypothetical protein
LHDRELDLCRRSLCHWQRWKTVHASFLSVRDSPHRFGQTVSAERERLGVLWTPERGSLVGSMTDAVPRANRPDTGTLVRLAPVPGRRPGRSRGGSGCGCQVGAARMSRAPECWEFRFHRPMLV